MTSPLCSHSYAFGHSKGALQSLLLCAGRLGPFPHRYQAATAHSSAAAQAAPAAPRGAPPALGAALPRHAPQQLCVSPPRPARPASFPDGGRAYRSSPPRTLCYIVVLSARVQRRDAFAVTGQHRLKPNKSRVLASRHLLCPASWRWRVAGVLEYPAAGGGGVEGWGSWVRGRKGWEAETPVTPTATESMTTTRYVHQSILLGGGQGRIYSHRDRDTKTRPAPGKTSLAPSPIPFPGMPSPTSVPQILSRKRGPCQGPRPRF